MAQSARTWLTIGLCCLAALAEGFDIQSMGVAAPTIAPALSLSRPELSQAFSASTLGLLFGALALGRLADRWGRRATLILSLAVFGVFSLASAAAWSEPSLLVARLLAGLGLGGAMPCIVALSSEAAGERSRARLVALGASALPFGGAVASLVAADLQWRAIFIVGGVWPLGLAAAMAVLLPESPELVRTRGGADRGPPIGWASALFEGGRATPTLLLWAAAAAALLSLFLILNWLPTLMRTKGASLRTAELVSLMFNVGGGLGALALAVLFRGERRALVFACWFVGMTLALVALAFSGPELARAGPEALAAGAFVSSTPTALYALAPDFYAAPIRGAGVGAVIGVGRVGAILGPFVAAAALGAGAGPGGALLALLPFVALAAAASFTLLVIRGSRGLARTARAPVR